MAAVFSPAYTEAQLEEVRKALRHQLRELGADSVISQLVSELQSHSGPDTQPVRPDQALQVLQDRGIVEQIAASIAAPPHLVAKTAAANLVHTATRANTTPPSNGRFLQVKLLGAKAVMDYVARQPLPGEMLQLHVELYGHRLTSEWVPATSEPAFTGEVFIPLPEEVSQPTTGTPHVVPLSLLPLRQPLHLVMTATTPTTLEPATEVAKKAVQGPEPSVGPWPSLSYSSSVCSVVAMGAGDWRTCLLRQRPVVVCVQMGGGPGMALGVPGGAAPACVVTLQLCIHPRPPTPLQEPLLQTQQRTEASRDAQCAASFVQRAKAWWAQYAYQSPALRTRPVRVLARAEDGTQRPTPSFVRPLQPGRALPTPRHAARWVALLRRRDADADLGAGPAGAAGAGGVTAPSTHTHTTPSTSLDCWCSLDTIVASRSASAEEAALVLCGLLLGFGLDAYVGVGRRRGGEGCVWVVTRAAFAQVTHWDPVTGARYTAGDATTCPFHTIGSLFNHKSVYANSQAEDAVMSVSYLLEEPSLWSELEVSHTDIPGPPWSRLPLDRPLVDLDTLEHTLEQQIRAVLTSEICGSDEATSDDNKKGVQTSDDKAVGGLTWDASLAHLLTPALDSYEFEAVQGVLAPGQEDFQTAIKRDTPIGWEFKGIPQHHRHLNAPLMALSLLDDPAARALIDGARRGAGGGGAAAAAVVALRVRVTAYPAGLFSTWVMLASKAPVPTA